MRIGISARTLAYPSGGAKEYLLGLLEAMLQLNSGHELILFYSQYAHVGTFPDATEVVLPCTNRVLFDWWHLPRALRRHHCDVALFPSSNMPPGIPCPAVVTVHDLGYFHPTLRMYKTCDTIYMRWAIRHTVYKAKRLLAVSEYTRQELQDLLCARPQSIEVIHEACDPMYKTPVNAADVAAFRQANALDRDFILYTGNISPRKNLATLLAAYARIHDSIPCDLTVTGGMAWSEDFENQVRQLGLTDRVIRLGHVNRQDMPLLYHAASAVAFPSFFEGFGLPVLEAQACGTPVVCANTTSLPEVAGHGALLVDPTSVDAWSEALTRIVTDTALREELIRKGHANEARFTWPVTAQKTLHELVAAAGSRL
jgi:glycosyltransferase involved in cell wall biosynthesis